MSDANSNKRARSEDDGAASGQRSAINRSGGSQRSRRSSSDLGQMLKGSIDLSKSLSKMAVNSVDELTETIEELKLSVDAVGKVVKKADAENVYRQNSIECIINAVRRDIASRLQQTERRIIDHVDERSEEIRDELSQIMNVQQYSHVFYRNSSYWEYRVPIIEESEWDCDFITYDQYKEFVQKLKDAIIKMRCCRTNEERTSCRDRSIDVVSWLHRHHPAYEAHWKEFVSAFREYRFTLNLPVHLFQSDEKSFGISRVDVPSQVWQDLGKCAHNTQFSKYYFEEMTLGAKFGSFIKNSLRENYGFESLSLNCCFVATETIKVICEEMCEISSNLVYRFQWTEFRTNWTRLSDAMPHVVSMYQVGDGVNRNPPEDLILSGWSAGLNPQLVPLLCELISHNHPRLKLLELRRCGINGGHVQQLKNALIQNSHLKLLDLRANDLTSGNMSQLAEAFYAPNERGFITMRSIYHSNHRCVIACNKDDGTERIVQVGEVQGPFSSRANGLLIPARDGTVSALSFQRFRSLYHKRWIFLSDACRDNRNSFLQDAAKDAKQLPDNREWTKDPEFTKTMVVLFAELCSKAPLYASYHVRESGSAPGKCHGHVHPLSVVYQCLLGNPKEFLYYHEHPVEGYARIPVPPHKLKGYWAGS